MKWRWSHSCPQRHASHAIMMKALFNSYLTTAVTFFLTNGEHCRHVWLHHIYLRQHAVLNDLTNICDLCHHTGWYTLGFTVFTIKQTVDNSNLILSLLVKWFLFGYVYLSVAQVCDCQVKMRMIQNCELSVLLFAIPTMPMAHIPLNK